MAKSNLHPILYNEPLIQLVDKTNEDIAATNILLEETGNTGSLTTTSTNLSDAVNEVNANVGNADVISDYFDNSLDVSDALIELLQKFNEAGMTGFNVASTMTTVFPGIIGETPIGYDRKFHPTFNIQTGPFTIHNVQAQSDFLSGSSGNTELILSDSPKGIASNNVMSLSLPFDETFSVNTEPVSVSKGSDLYLYCNAAAGHSDLVVNFTLEG